MVWTTTMTKTTTSNGKNQKKFVYLNFYPYLCGMEKFEEGKKYFWGIYLGLQTTYTNYGTIRREHVFRTDKTDGNKTPVMFRLFVDEVPREDVEVTVQLPEQKQSSEFIVDGEQLAKLKKIGFDSRKLPYTEAVTVGWALRWLRDNFGIAHTIYPRHMAEYDIRFSLGHIIQPIDNMTLDLSEGKYDETDGVIDTIEELEFSALDFALDFILSKGGIIGYWKWVEWNLELDAEEKRSKARTSQDNMNV